MKKLLKIALLILVVISVLTSCDEFVLYDIVQPASQRTPASIYPAVAAIFVLDTQNFIATGGTEDYVFTVEGSGSGTINPASGVYTAPSTSGTYTVSATDTLGSSVQATVFVMDHENLTLVPTSVTINTDASYTFAAYGGAPPYTFSVIPATGAGSIDGSGVYTAESTAGSAVVRVTDSNLIQRDAGVTTVETGPLTLSPSTPTIDENGTIQFAGSGGVIGIGYIFAIDGGEGTIVNGLYSPAGYVGTDLATISLEDFDGPPTIVTTTVTVLPAAPTDLYADGTAGGSQDIELSWTDNSSVETEYKIKRTDLITMGIDYITIAANAETYMDTGLSPSKRFRYEVYAVAGVLESNPSNAYEAESNP